MNPGGKKIFMIVGHMNYQVVFLRSVKAALYRMKANPWEIPNNLTKENRVEAIKLKSCPFCGNEVSFVEYDPDGCSMFPTDVIKIECCISKVEREKYFYERDGRKTRGLKPLEKGGCYFSQEEKVKKEMAKIWNRRA